MQSGLITEILEVESEAEKLVSDARTKGRAILAEAQASGEKLVREPSQRAREKRYLSVQIAKDASEMRIKEASSLLALKQGDAGVESSMADSCIDSAVEIICRTRIGKGTRR